MGVFGCFEVTIGWFGKERVDYLTYDTKGIWRCYEIKVSKADFYSNAHNTFLGHYNYYVMPPELYAQLKDEIPSHIGVYTGKSCQKKAKKQKLTVDDDILKESLIRSLYREAEQVIKSKDPSIIKSLQQQVKNQEKQTEKAEHKYWDLVRKCQKKCQEEYGSKWYKDFDLY